MTEDQIAEMRKRCEAATPCSEWPITGITACGCPDCSFNAHARTDLPVCLDEIERLRREINRLKALIRRYVADPHWVDGELKAEAKRQ